MRGHHLLLMLLCVAAALGAEPKRDRFGDPLPEGAVARLGSLRLRNEEPILSAAFAADGKSLIAAGGGAISFWDPVTGKSTRHVKIQNAAPRVRVGCLSADGKTLVYSLPDYRNVAYVVDANSGAQQRTLSRAQGGFVVALDLSRDGKVLAIASFSSIALWDVPGGKLLHEFKDPLPRTLSPRGVIALTPDGKQLVLPHADGSLHLVDVASGKELRALEMPPIRANPSYSHSVDRMTISPDGRYLAFSGFGAPLRLCELATGKRLHELKLSGGGSRSGLAFTPDGRTLAVEERSGICLFDVASGKETRKLPAVGGTSNLLFSPDGRMLAMVRGYSIRFGDMAAQRWLHPLTSHEGLSSSLAFFPDGKRLLCAGYTGMKIWDIASAQILAEKTSNLAPMCLTVDPDGESVRFADHEISAHHWDPRTGRDEVRRRGVVISSFFTNTLALSPDGRSLAIPQEVYAGGARQKRTKSEQLRLYDVKTKEYKALPGLPPRAGVSHVRFTPDSRRLAVRSHDGVVRLWDRDTGKLVRELKRDVRLGPGMHLTLSFAADGRSLLTWVGNRLCVLECAGGAARVQIPYDPMALNTITYASDARFIACGHSDGRILVYSAIGGKQLAQWQGKQGSISSLVFSPDSRLLASGGENGTILIWKVPEDDSIPVIRTAREVDSLWQALGSLDAAAANRALAGLTAAPAQALPLFKERLPSIGNPPSQAQLARLIAELDDDSFKVRDRATRELTLIGVEAAEALRQALDSNPSAESKRRIEDLLPRLKKDGYSRRLGFLRAIEVLERIGTPQAKELLRELAGKPLSDELKEEVQASLRRMGDKP